jgi:ATP-dependent exoDNAse (exonuclease V) alpha subunit
MKHLAKGARQLPVHHITIRVPWHDAGWAGSVCTAPLKNTSCLVLPRIGQGRRDDVEFACAGQRLDKLEAERLPPCLGERVSFMAPFEITRTMRHPYAEMSPATHGHFRPTRFTQPPFSAAAVPFRWMLLEKVAGDAKKDEPGFAEALKLGWVAEREPDMSFESSWVQEGENQQVVLDTFFSAVKPQESLCFFYAKRTPLSEQSRRVIVGVGRVLSKGQPTEYAFDGDAPPLRCLLWERNVGHSIRPGSVEDGFLLPYQEILALAESGRIANPEDYVAFAPDDQFGAYSFGSELLTHDGAVASLLACAAALHRIQERLQGPWKQALTWIDRQLNRLWQARGAFPGLGAALAAFGYEWGFRHGGLLAYEIDLKREESGGNPWQVVDAVMRDPSLLPAAVAQLLTDGLREGWKNLSSKHRAMLDLLSRCNFSPEQALRIYDKSERSEAGIVVRDEEVLANPYLLYECDRRSPDPIAFATIDRGIFPDEALRRGFPLAEPSRIEDPADSRRVRALVTDILEEAAGQGHTLLPRDWVIRRARDRALQPPCPLGENVLDAREKSFEPIISRVTTKDRAAAYQIDHLASARAIIRREVMTRLKGKPHIAQHDWRTEVDKGLVSKLPSNREERATEERARAEKAGGLEQLYRSRLAVLIGSAGTGKTTLLKMLCNLPGITEKGLLLLAPTGKARVRLEEQTGQRDAGKTLAQFLNRFGRYDGETGAYFPDAKASKCGDYRTIIVDECSMLTEDQLAALFDACSNVERYILVGDPRQLPPIGAGRPFVDIVRQLEPANVEAIFPRCAPGYAELTVPRRQTDPNSPDVLLASHFSGASLDPAADEAWDAKVSGKASRLRLVQWSDPQNLQEKIIQEVVAGLGLEGVNDELGFELSLGGSTFEDGDRAYFWSKYKDNPGAASKVEAWQILSPVREGLEGVEALNRAIQARFRLRWRMMAETTSWARKVPKPIGPQALVYGDKVINVVNQKRRDVWPKPEGEAYIANGDLGIVVGQYKTKSLKGMPWKLEVEFAGQLGAKFGFWPGEFGDEGANPLHLAYALTVHKTQGSEFGITFVVLPNPCWLLSRELLYTALTRHKDRLVILHQGSFAEFRRFAGEQHSVIAERMTNLFLDPLPQEVVVGQKTAFLEASLIHRTERGELVRSKSELVIADKLHARRVNYAYEQPLVLPSGAKRYPDFTIDDAASGNTYYWEHLGMLEDPGYRQRWDRKRVEYESAGIREGGGENGTLIVTRDQSSGGLDGAAIAKLIDSLSLA